MKTPARRIPEGYQEQLFNSVNACLYFKATREDGMIAAMFFTGRRKNPDWHFLFRTKEQLTKKVDNCVKSLLARIEWKEQEKIAKKERTAKFKDDLKPGVILSTSWGYEQTNVDFFQVIEVKGSFVTVREVGHIQTEETGPMSCMVKPAIDSFIDKPIKRKIGDQYIKINESVSPSLWNGKPTYKSWYY